MSKVRGKSPLRVRCRKLAFNIKACDWTAVREFKAAEFSARKGAGSAIVHHSSKQAGKWQVSFFDEQGPSRDSQHSSLTDALREVPPKRWRLRDFG